MRSFLFLEPGEAEDEPDSGDSTESGKVGDQQFGRHDDTLQSRGKSGFRKAGSTSTPLSGMEKIGMRVQDQPGWIEHTQILLNSFRKFVGRELIDRTGTAEEQAQRLFEAPFVVVSHGTEADPILNYGNQTALDLWEIDVAALLRMPSRLTAEPVHRDERARLLERTLRDGFVDDYRGIRISATGCRFLIERAIVWNLVNAAGERVGQAATFDNWQFLSE